MRVGDIAVGRAGDKGAILDLTLVAKDDASYALIERAVTAEAAQRALKFVAPEALPGGVYASLHAGVHWQKSAISVLLELEI